jgi:hypothetical protein
MEVELEVLAATGKFAENFTSHSKARFRKKKHSFIYMLPKQETITFGF